MVMKAAHSEDNANKSITGSTRQHLLSRLHKAIKHAEEMVALVSDRAASGATDVDVLEAKAYAYSLAGAAAFEKQAEGIQPSDASSSRWKSCLVNYSAARVIYTALLKTTKKELFKEFLVTAVDPGIRYAAYQYRIPRTVGVPAVSQKFFPKEDAELVQAVEKLDADALREEEPTSSGMLHASAPSLSQAALTVDQERPSRGEVARQILLTPRLAKL
jgi:signal recognition particle subunit SRP68